jgi:hypothetical protein
LLDNLLCYRFAHNHRQVWQSRYPPFDRAPNIFACLAEKFWGLGPKPFSHSNGRVPAAAALLGVEKAGGMASLSATKPGYAYAG